MNTIDDRLSRLFRAIDVPPDFEARVMARVHAESVDNVEERARSARKLAQQTHDTAGRDLRQWYRAALKILTLDALGGATLLVVLIVGLPRLAPLIAAFGPSNAVALLALLVAGSLVVEQTSNMQT
jgi:hypothetical protein